VLRDSSPDPRVHQFFNRMMSKEAAWAITQIQIIFV
jgi:hypothetical protein